MNLEESNEFAQEENNKSKKKKMILLLIIFCIIGIVGLFGLIGYLKIKDNNTKKIFLNQERKNLSSTLFIEQDGNSYVSAEEFSNLLGYKYHPGEYKKYNQDENFCYIETDYEIISIQSDSKNLKKYLINSKDTRNLEDDENTVEKETVAVNNTNSNNTAEMFIVKSKNDTMKLFDLSTETIKYNNNIYVPVNDIEKIFNIKYEINGSRTYISNLYYLYQTTLNFVKNNEKYTEVSNCYENVLALVDDLLIVKNDSNKYGVVSLETGKTIIDFIYTDIQYLQNKEEFFVYTENSVGLINKNKETIISPTSSYEELTVFDEINQLYMAKSKKGYGILNRRGDVVVPVSFENVGLDSFESFENFELSVESDTPNLLQSKYIIVYDNDKLGLYDVEGNQILKTVYDDFGYIATDEDKEEGFDSVLLLPKESGINGIIIKQNDLYGIFDLDGVNVLVPCSLTKVYSVTRDGQTEYFMLFDDQEINVSDYFSDYVNDESEMNQENDDKNDENNENDFDEENNNENNESNNAENSDEIENNENNGFDDENNESSDEEFFERDSEENNGENFDEENFDEEFFEEEINTEIEEEN